MRHLFLNGPAQNGPFTFDNRPGKAVGIRLAAALNAILDLSGSAEVRCRSASAVQTWPPLVNWVWGRSPQELSVPAPQRSCSGHVSKSGVSLWHDHGMLRLTDFIIDCPDTMELAAFYSEVTGRPIKEGSSENWAGIQFGEIELAFIRVDDYRAPQWPDSEHPKQFHLDFEVDEIESEQRRVLDLGATLRQDFIGPNGYGWQVYTDPIGHPFCLCRNKGVIWTDQGPIWPKHD